LGSYENALAVRPHPRIVLGTMGIPFGGRRVAKHGTAGVTAGAASEAIVLPSKRKVTNPRAPARRRPPYVAMTRGSLLA
jgi:hypothetical protein